MVFDPELAAQSVSSIVFEDGTEGKGRLHPVYRFYDKQNRYICEVRYGGASANALQRGLWTHTRNGEEYFDSISGGWIDYSHNMVLVELFSHALVSTSRSHTEALKILKDDIDTLRSRK